MPILEPNWVIKYGRIEIPVFTEQNRKPFLGV
jgi:hypothetical protein